MIEHAPFELDELRSGFDAEFLGEVAAQLLERAQRVRLPAGAIRGEHALRAEAFVERVLLGERLELAQRFEELAAFESCLGAQRQRVEPAPFEPAAFGA